MDMGSICTREVVAIDRGATLQAAAQMMREHHVGSLVVTREGEEGLQVAGIVTDRDLAIQVLASGIDGALMTVGALVGEAPLVIVAEATLLAEAISVMRERGVRRLLVRNDEGQLAGIVSFDDVFEACAAQIAGLSQVLRKGIERESAERSKLTRPPPPVLRVPAVGTVGWQGESLPRR